LTTVYLLIKRGTIQLDIKFDQRSLSIILFLAQEFENNVDNFIMTSVINAVNKLNN